MKNCIFVQNVISFSRMSKNYNSDLKILKFL